MAFTILPVFKEEKFSELGVAFLAVRDYPLLLHRLPRDVNLGSAPRTCASFLPTVTAFLRCCLSLL